MKNNDSFQNNKDVQDTSKSAFWVATGIFLSRIFGFLRERAIAHYFGNSDLNDAFKAAYRIPNFLQNLLGEGVLSASFIPVYAESLALKKDEEAREVAFSVFWLLFLLVSVLSFLGIFFAPQLLPFVAPGFTGEKQELTIKLVQILFPGTAILVLSAWCLGVLNTHGKFFLSYSAPVIWNLTQMIVLLLCAQSIMGVELIEALAWSLLLGSFLQFLIQVPQVLKALKKVSFHFNLSHPRVQLVIHNFLPILFSRGVVQVSAYVDVWLASLLPSGAVSSMSFAQMLYLLPISLFGMSISAAELPAMSSVVGDPKSIFEVLKTRIQRSSERIAFFVVPSVVVFVFLGNALVGMVFQTGAFNQDNNFDVWRALAGSSIGLLAATLGRIYSSAFYAIKDTKTPMKFALIRVALTIGLGFLMGLKLPQYLKELDPNFNSMWGLAGLTSSAGIAAWVEFLLLKNKMTQKMIEIRAIKTSSELAMTPFYLLKLWSVSLCSAAVAYLIHSQIKQHPLIGGAISLSVYSLIFGILAVLLKLGPAINIQQKLMKRFAKKTN